MSFENYTQALARRAQELAATHTLVLTNAGDLWEIYLGSFPIEEQQYNNCNCCRRFIQAHGGLLFVKEDGRGGVSMTSLWDFEVEAPFNEINAKLHALVMAAPIEGPFLTKENLLGTPSNFSTKHKTKFFHFHARIGTGTYDIGKKNNDLNVDAQLFRKGLESITKESIDKVLSLGNRVNRISSYKPSLEAMKVLLSTYETLSPKEKEAFLWASKTPFKRLSSNCMGDLLIDLSKGVGLEIALGQYNHKTASENYQMSSAPVGESQVEKARDFFIENGYRDSFGRAPLSLSDLTMDYLDRLLYVNTVSDAEEGDPFALVASKATPKKVFPKETLSLDDFLKGKYRSVEVLFTGDVSNRLMSLTTMRNKEAPSLFYWKNPVAWHYRGGVADSIAQRVKDKGGNLNGLIVCSMKWDGECDLDLHARIPGGHHVYYGTKRMGGAHLDVDMNVGHKRPNACENIAVNEDLRDGVYEFYVNNYSYRGQNPPGFSIRLKVGDKIYYGLHSLPVRGSNVRVAEITVTNGVPTLTTFHLNQIDGGENVGEKIWGLSLGHFHKIEAICHSPNYWGTNTGLKHTFFLIEGCHNDESLPGIFNEFVPNELKENYRKVIQLMGEACKIDEKTISGLGLSTGGELIFRLDGKRIVKVINN